MMCTSAASSRKGEQQLVTSQGKQKKPLHVKAIIGNTWQRWTGQANPKAMRYCTEEQGSCEAWEFIYFTSHKAQRVWPPPKAATGKAPLILALRSVDRWLKFGKRCWDEQLACCWGELELCLALLWPLLNLQLVSGTAALHWGAGRGTAVCC